MKSILLILLYCFFSSVLCAQVKLESDGNVFYFTGNDPRLRICITRDDKDFLKIKNDPDIHSIKIKWADYTNTVTSRYYIYSLKKLLEKADTVIALPESDSLRCRKMKFEFPDMPGVYEMELDAISNNIWGSGAYRHADSIYQRYKLFINADQESHKPNSISNGIVGAAMKLEIPDFDPLYWVYADSLVNRIDMAVANQVFSNQNKAVNDTSRHCADDRKKYAGFAVIISNQSAKDTSFFQKYGSMSFVIDPVKNPKSDDLRKKIQEAAMEMLNTFFDSTKHFVDTAAISSINLDTLGEYYKDKFAKYRNDDIYWSKGFLENSLRKILGFNMKRLSDSCKLNYVFHRKSHMINQLIFYGKVEVGIEAGDPKDAIKDNSGVENKKQPPVSLKVDPPATVSQAPEPPKTDKSGESHTIPDSLNVDLKLANPLNTNFAGINAKNGISGLIENGGIFYMVEERNAFIRAVNANSIVEEASKLIDGSRLNGKVAFEGLAIYNNDYLLVTNEEINSGNRIYYHKFSGSRDNFDTVKFTSGREKILYDTDDYGIEGIAVSNDSCYVLKERNENDSSYIRLFAIKIRNNKPVLDYKNVVIAIKQEHDYRYTDISYYAPGSCIYAIRSKKGGDFYIDKIKVGTLLKRGLSVYSISPSANPEIIESRKLDLSKYVNSTTNLTEKPNLEGITVYNDYIYMVSDNMYGARQGDTIFMKIKLF